MKNPVRVLLLLLLTAPLHAQEPAAVRKVGLPNLDAQVAAKLAALDARLDPVHAPNLAASLLANVAPSPLGAFTPLLADRHNNEAWEQLPDDYYRVMQESGEALVPTAEKALGSGWTCAQVRRLCHQRLASLPRSSLALYRQRVDAEAKALLEQGKQARSPLPLRRLVDDLFCSTYGDQALDLLGDLAFERGQFEDARHWWGLLTPLGPPAADPLRFPNPRVDLVRVQAKQILALIFQGRLNEARSAITRFEERHPRAAGHLAGQQGVFAKTLAKTLDSFKQERIANNAEAWTTFGGDPTRNRVLSQGLSVHLLEDGHSWSVPLPVLFAAPERSSPARRAAFHPIIVNDQVLIADHRSVVSYHLTTGKEVFRYDLKGAGLSDPGLYVSDENRLPRFSLSADSQGRAYVRLGRLDLTPKKAGDKEQVSYLVCLDLTQPHLDKKRELWHIQASADAKSVGFFEGTPLVHDGRVYIALSKLTDRQVVTSIVCYDTLGRQRWTREVCECPEFAEQTNGPRYRQHLLTLGAGQIVYCSHTGAIVAVDAATGQPTWGVRYPSRGPLTADLEPSPRDLAPCVYAEGRIYAAPLDSDRLFCVDAVTGQVCWEAEEIEVAHLLGVADERVFVATRNGLRALRTTSGQTDWTQPIRPSLGRGLLAGGWLFCPTQDANRAFTLREGDLQRIGAPSVLPEEDQYETTRLQALTGNWALGQGCLAIAGKSDLVVYVPSDPQSNRFPMTPRPDARLHPLYPDARMSVRARAPSEGAFPSLGARALTLIFRFHSPDAE
jgi:outer membrane protein assembly factor BamB